MSDRQTIFAAALAALEGISIAGGYSFDAAGKVFDWRNTPINPTGETLAIELRDVELNRAGEMYRTELGLVAALYFIDDSAPGATMRQMEADILRAFSTLPALPEVLSAEFVGIKTGIAVEEYRQVISEVSIRVYFYGDAWTI